MSGAAPADGTQATLARIPLFAGIPPGAVQRVERFMARFEIPRASACSARVTWAAGCT